MIKKFILPALALAFILSSAACTRVAPSGAKQRAYSNVQFRFNNNQVSKAKLYKRYIDHNLSNR